MSSNRNELSSINFIDRIPDWVIQQEPEACPEVAISDRRTGDRLLSGKLWPDWSGTLRISLKELLKDFCAGTMFYPDDLEPYNTRRISLHELGEDSSFEIIVNMFSSDAKTQMSDIDEMDIPEDYRLSVSYITDFAKDANLITPTGKEDLWNDYFDLGSYESSAGEGTISTEIYVNNLNLRGADTFYVQVDLAGLWRNKLPYSLKSPVFHIVPGEYEQYLFYNRFGGWDNIAMKGRRSVVPDMEFTSEIRSGSMRKSKHKVERKYTQDSGYLTKKTIAALLLLMESPSIYHKTPSGAWRPIVIEECSPTINSDDTIHSLSFTYRYSEDFETYEI